MRAWHCRPPGREASPNQTPEREHGPGEHDCRERYGPDEHRGIHRALPARGCYQHHQSRHRRNADERLLRHLAAHGAQEHQAGDERAGNGADRIGRVHAADESPRIKAWCGDSGERFTRHEVAEASVLEARGPELLARDALYRELVESLPPAERGGVAVLNADDPACAGYLASVQNPVLTVGQKSLGEVTAILVERVRSELGRVTWPTRREVWATTVVVILVSTFFGLYLWTVDLLLSWIQTLLFGRQ